MYPKKLLQVFSQALFCFLLPNTILCVLSKHEEKNSIKRFAPPLEVQKQIDLFFTYSNVQNLFISRPRCQFLQKSGTRQFSPQARNQWALNQNNARDLWKSYFNEEFINVCKQFDITSLASLEKNTFILESKKYWPGFILKISKDEWATTNENRSPEVIRYKNTSRVFYNNKLEEFITKTNAKHLLCLKKYLYHIPGQPHEISDRNYCVLAEKFENLPEETKNKEAIKSLFNLEKQEIKNEFIPMIKELIQAMFYTGIADIRPHNVFLINNNGILKFLFIDTERHGFYDSDQNFFHKNPAEIKASAKRGIYNLCKTILRLSDNETYILTTKLQSLISTSF